jgi:hypothetical protein
MSCAERRGLTPSGDTEIISRVEVPMNSPARVLMQTTIPPTADDWSIARFSQLQAYLADLRDELGSVLFEVTARDRAPLGVPDPILANLGELDFDSLWLFAVDTGDGLTREDCAGITRFRKRGGGVLLTRDHMDLGSSLCSLGGLGDANHFHSKNIDPDISRQTNDDPYTTSILWPNFHSGANGDFQQITIVEPLHPVLTDPDAPGGRIQFLPAHPHEGAVDAPKSNPSARVIATGKSKITARVFNIAVAFETSAEGGRAIAQSTFHHFADYNWDTSFGKPSFVTEAPGHALADSSEAQRSIRQYAANVALWLAHRPTAAEHAHQDAQLDEALEESFPASDTPAVGLVD